MNTLWIACLAVLVIVGRPLGRSNANPDPTVVFWVATVLIVLFNVTDWSLHLR